jgi:hypothetical protein
VRIFLKDGKEHEIPNDWITTWESLHYNVKAELLLAIQWSMDHEQARKTRRGLRGFLGNWVRRKCPLKPVEKPKALVNEPVEIQPLSARLSRLAELKAAIK